MTCRYAKGVNTTMDDGAIVYYAPETAATLTAGISHTPGVNPPGRRQEDDHNVICITGGITHTLTTEGSVTEDGTGGGTPIVPMDEYGVRRLSPTECERLQGYDDGWTEYGIKEDSDKIVQSDSQRYRQLGNSVAVPVVSWIAEGLVDVDRILAESPRTSP